MYIINLSRLFLLGLNKTRWEYSLRWVDNSGYSPPNKTVSVYYQPIKVISTQTKTCRGNSLGWVDNSGYSPPNKTVSVYYQPIKVISTRTKACMENSLR